MSKKSKLERIESEKLEELFENSFKSHIGKCHNITLEECEYSIERESASVKPKVKVTVFGMAGTTTLAEYYDVKNEEVIKGANKIPLMDGENKICDFVFDNALVLNSNDYVVYYVEM